MIYKKVMIKKRKVKEMSTIPRIFHLLLHDEHVGHSIQVVDTFAVININGKIILLCGIEKEKMPIVENILRNIISMDKKHIINEK